MTQLLSRLCLALGGTAVAITLVTVTLLWQMGMLNRRGVTEALEFVSENSPASVVAAIKMELGMLEGISTDPGYGRELVPGRGHAPWVLRANLDQRPRMLVFAPAPDWWVAYQVESAGLYQVWRGDLNLQGSVYDYRHGPQPTAAGDWYLRHEQLPRWQIRVGGTTLPAQVNYLGHRYGPDRATAWIEYELIAGDTRVTISERPELNPAAGGAQLERHFRVDGNRDDLVVLLHQGEQEAIELAPGNTSVSTLLQTPTPIALATGSEAVAGEGESERGRRVIANSDCLGCHGETQEVVGPSFSRVAKRYQGNLQSEPLAALTDSILLGGQGKWGQVPMPGHPAMSRADARAAVVYIMGLAHLEAELDVPTDASGQEYAATEDYDVGPRLSEVHPAFKLTNLLPEGFEPKVGGMDFRPDGKLVVASWDRDGGVFLLDPAAPADRRVTRIAEGLQEPLGLTVADGRLFVLQKQELTELVDTDGDQIIDQYRTIVGDWPATSNFHSFAFGMVRRDRYLYGLFSICIQPGGAACPEQLSSQGKAFRVSLDSGELEYVATGFRTPNGIGLGPGKELFVTDNQGDWLPSSKLLHLQPGHFYGARGIADADAMTAQETPPVVWLPQDEIGNSPTQPALLTEGPYAGQMVFGDVYHGGLKRVFMEQVNGALQGAVFRFSAGFRGGINRILRGPDGDLYLGEIGNPPNWGELDKAWHGLEKFSYRGAPAYELLQVRATARGFDLVLSEPLAQGLEPRLEDLVARQWFYYPTEQYGGPKYDPSELQATSLTLSADRRTLRATLPGLKAGYVVYLALDPRLKSDDGNELWAREAWYTLNAIPDNATGAQSPRP